MEYTTHKVFSKHTSIEVKREYISREDTCSCCDHVEESHEKLYAIIYNNCSYFGDREGYACCEECYKKAIEAEDEELLTCNDCGKEVPRKDSVEWKWYDFSRSAGDEPLVICSECKSKEKHVARVRKDTADYEEECRDSLD